MDSPLVRRGGSQKPSWAGAGRVAQEQQLCGLAAGNRDGHQGQGCENLDVGKEL